MNLPTSFCYYGSEVITLKELMRKELCQVFDQLEQPLDLTSYILHCNAVITGNSVMANVGDFVKISYSDVSIGLINGRSFNCQIIYFHLDIVWCTVDMWKSSS